MVRIAKEQLEQRVYISLHRVVRGSEKECTHAERCGRYSTRAKEQKREREI